MGYVSSLLGRNERLVFVTRQHWIQLVPVGVTDLLILAALIVAGVLLSQATLGVFLVVAIVLSLVPLFHFGRRVAWWWNEKYIVTNRRVIQIEGILDKHVIDSSLEKVNDVVLRQSALGRIVDYGNIEILTGSEIGVNQLSRIHRPILFKTEMLNQKEAMGEIDAFEMRSRRILANEAPTAGDIPELIAELDELRQKGILTLTEFEDKKLQLLDRL
jgi:uncharacterized membrane protein YdbT with pleckstrin-like domain